MKLLSTERPGVVQLDVDQVCLDLNTAWCATFTDKTGYCLVPSDFKSWNFLDFVPAELHDAFDAVLCDPTLYDRVEPIPGAQEGVESLRHAGHEIAFVTSSGPTHMAPQLDCLGRLKFLKPVPRADAHGEYNVMHRKARFLADLAIDDAPHNIIEGHAAGKSGLLFPAHHNEAMECDAPRLAHWDGITQHVADALLLRREGVLTLGLSLNDLTVEANTRRYPVRSRQAPRINR